MFNHIYLLNQSLNKWYVSNVTNINEMFMNAENFNQDFKYS